ncbi:hypothetical protein EKO27_g10126 [Xylaria grammica]|uniref:NB-ARC domain-containing protein n=1 Tax=Xylaria grammica TaxID=363999 RepID=A0A439CS60_9PEZI|nr:hypothetical protein EKO27_g10126 [Xylaria grammica]
MPSLKKLLKRANRESSPKHPQRLEVVYEDPDASLEIVAVHGLNRHREKTWTAANGVHWLRDRLLKDLPRVRILIWGYDANTRSPGRVGCQYLYDHALELVSDLTRKRILTQSVERPIIFVAHSLGGLVLKSALIRSATARQNALSEHRSVKTSTYGVVYMGTPHQGGSGAQLGRVLVNVASLFIAADDRILKHLERDSEWLQQQLSQYNPISGQFVTKFVVPKASAVVPGQANAEPMAINSDHINMVKFSGNTDRGYTKVSETLQIMAKDAGEAIRSRWEEEARIDHDVVLDTAKDELFAVKGCGKLAIVCLGGVGKTQLALQLAYFVKESEPDYSVFWVPALSHATFEQAYSEIAKRLSIQAKGNEDLNDSVRKYPESERAGKWLLIVDNADDMETLFASSDNPGGIHKYLPTSNNGLAVFTARSRQVAVDVGGSNVVDLHKMSVEEATEFLGKSPINKQLLQKTATGTTLIQKYLELLRSPEQSLVSLMSREFRDEFRYQGSQNAVATTWLVSFNQIRRSDSNAANLLSFLSYIEPKAIPQSILPKPLVVEEMENAIGLLYGHSSVVAKGRHYTGDPNSGHSTPCIHFPVFQKGKPVAVARIPATRETCFAGCCLYEDRRFKEAVVALEETYQWRKQYLAEEDQDLLGPEYALANAYLNDRQISDAIAIFKHVIAVQQGMPKEDDHNVLVSGQGLAAAYLQTRQTREAITILEHVVAIRQKTLKEDDDDRLQSEYWLTRAYLTTGQRIGDAIAILEHVLAVERGLDISDEDRSVSQDLLDEAYSMQLPNCSHRPEYPPRR